jgi:death-on-curing protein
VTEYIEPDDVDELLEVEGFHYRDRGLLLSALAAPLPTFGEEVHPGPHQKRPC